MKPYWHFGNSSFSRRRPGCSGSSGGGAESFAGDAGAGQSVSDLIVVCRLDCCFPAAANPDSGEKVTALTRF